MHCAATTFMPCVECSEQLDDLSASHLADADAIRTHSQRLSYEITHGDHARAFDVRGSGLHADHVTASRVELGRVFDEDETLVIADA
jgi:hypothetical protein